MDPRDVEMELLAERNQAQHVNKIVEQLGRIAANLGHIGFVLFVMMITNCTQCMKQLP
jgi:hypothetical protein